MSLRKLVDRLADIGELPIEIDEVRDHLVDMGIQDKIIFSPENMDPAKVRGILYKYTQSNGVYANPDLVSLIVYSENLSLDWQRVVCSKEMVHLFDRPSESAKSPAEVQSFLDKLLGPMATEDYGLADLMAATDKLAVYQSLPLLFPRAAREKALAEVKAGKKTPQQIAEWAALPETFIHMLLSEGWPSLCDLLVDGSTEERM